MKSRRKLNPSEPKSFKEFVDEMTRATHDALLRGGSVEMRGEIWRYLSYFAEWNSITKEIIR